MLEDHNGDVRSIAAVSLGQLGFYEAIDSLVKTLNDPESKVADSAAEALAKMGDRKTLGKLQRLLPTLDPSRAETVQHTIEEIQTRLRI